MASKDTGRLRVYIVDDNFELAAIYSAALSAEGFDVQRCKDTTTAVAEGIAFRPNLILLDIMMPGLNGYDALGEFRGAIETSTAIVIMFSALNQPEDIAKAQQLGADGYIVKSTTTVADVVAEVKAALNVSAQPPTNAASDQSTQGTTSGPPTD